MKRTRFTTKRTLLGILVLLLLAGAVWVGGGLLPVSATYRITTEYGESGVFALTVSDPGLFVDLQFPAGSTVSSVSAGGESIRPIPPWPGTMRRRVLAFWRPVQVGLGEGAGPFRIADQPVPVKGPVPPLVLPAGWTQVGDYAGRLTVLTTDPLRIAAPEGFQPAPEAVDRVRNLYAAMGKLAGVAPVREPAVVLTGPEPDRAAAAVVDLWIPSYDADAYWWQKGAAAFYTARLLQQTKLWTPTDEKRWEKEHAKDKEYILVVWLDAMIRTSSNRQRSLDTMLAPALSVQTNRGLLSLVKEVGGATTADKLERMLLGREPLPATGL
ncbi:MAG TPA: hypothetical protein VK464_16810 [Symbiobacteriaceae bacterium]|jgi:hypothetical protein|nr:hypothetical protein [Symbiobacteriaceae bacterium]